MIKAVEQPVLISNEEIAASLSLADAIKEVEKAFLLLAEGKLLDSSLMHLNAEDGEYHIKGGVIKYSEEEIYFGLKSNGRFIQNKKRYGLPNINGMIYLSDARYGTPLAMLDSGHITKVRTAAATAVAVKYLAAEDARVATVCGAGVQGKVQLEAVCSQRAIEQAFIYDLDSEQAKESARFLRNHLGISVTAIDKPEKGTRESDIIVCCTPATQAYLQQHMVKEKVFIAALGSDSPGKQELSPELVANSQVVADLKTQVLKVGEMQYQAPEKATKILQGELHEFVSGQKPRPELSRPLVFDSTGTALQDIAAALVAWKKVTQA